MTKKKNEQRHIKNRTWEKDRRDRLNTTFDKLAKLLPEYQPKITFSKIEILSKSIDYIEDLREKLRDLLEKKDASTLRTHKEVDGRLKALVLRNSSLVALLKKFNIEVPSVHDDCSQLDNNRNENSKNKANTDGTQIDLVVSVQKKKKKSKEKLMKTSPKIRKGSSKINENKLVKDTPKTVSNGLPELGEIQKFGSVELIPVSKPFSYEDRLHNQPIKNSVEITPLITSPGDNVTLHQKTEEVCTPNESITKDSMNVQDVNISKTSTDSSKIFDNSEKAIPLSITERKQSIESRSPSENDVKQIAEQLEVEENGVANKAPPDFECTQKEPDADLCTKNQETNAINKTGQSDDKLLECKKKTEKPHKNTEKIELDTFVLPPQSEVECAVKHITNIIESKDNEKDLHDELFENFQLTQTPSESNPNTMSPTAAFLLSFPVVSTVTSAKPENSFAEGANLQPLDDKASQPKDHSLFESISSILNDLNAVPENKQVANTDTSTEYPYKLKSDSCAIENQKTDVVSDTSKSYKGSDKSQSDSKQQKSSSKISTVCTGAGKINRSPNKKSSVASFDEKKPSTVTEIACPAVSSLSNAKALSLPSSSSCLPTLKLPETNTNSTNLSQNNNQSDFYVSLSTLGLPNKSSFAPTPLNPPVSSHFNFQISSLTQPRNIIESRPLIAEPFTFSLTKCTENTTTTSVAPTTSHLSQFDDHNQILNRIGRSSKKSTPTKHLVSDRFVVPTEPPPISTLNRSNTFVNPFAFDTTTVLSTPSSLGLSSLTTAPSSTISTPFTFTLTPTFSSISASTPILTNYDPLFTSSYDIPPLTCSSVKATKKEKAHPISTSEKDHVNYMKSMKSSSASVSSKPSKNHVNWMTSSVTKPSQDIFMDFGSTSYCTAVDENQPWSPNRAVDNTNLMTTPVLPTLHGDLALNTISSGSTTIPKYEIENRKSIIKANSSANANSHNSNTNHHKMNQRDSNHLKASTSRKFEQNIQTKVNKSEKSLYPHNNYQSLPVPIVPPKANDGPSFNNFHSVSQLLEHERQTTTKENNYGYNEQKFSSKDYNNSLVKQRYYGKCETENINQQANDRLAANSYSSNNDLTANDCDRELAPYNSYFFAQPKRIKLNYSSSDYFSNQSANNYDSTVVTNDIYPSYSSYQTNENDCNNIATSCINSIPNQSYAHQSTQSQVYHQQHQQFYPHIQQNACETIDPLLSLPPLPNRTHNTSNYFQNPSSYSNSKSQNYSENYRDSIGKQHNSQPFKSDVHPSSVQSSNKNSNRSSSACPPKVPHSNSLNNLPLNQAWNDFSWMTYSNPIEKPCNPNLYPIENSNKPMNVNNGNANNTIPNFNLTTIFPDCNKS